MENEKRKGIKFTGKCGLRIPRLRKRQTMRISKALNRFESRQIASTSKWPKVSNRLGVRPPPRGHQSASTTMGGGGSVAFCAHFWFVFRFIFLFVLLFGVFSEEMYIWDVTWVSEPRFWFLFLIGRIYFCEYPLIFLVFLNNN